MRRRKKRREGERQRGRGTRNETVVVPTRAGKDHSARNQVKRGQL